MTNFDCHAHVYETVTAVAGARYSPATPAPLQSWLDLQDQHGVKGGGVIVQVSFLDTDNSELCAALAKLNPNRFAGVTVGPVDISDAGIDHLVKAGVRGIRWNLVRGKAIPDVSTPEIQGLLAKLCQRGLHLELHLEGSRLAPILPQLVNQGVPIVADYFGLPSNPDPKQDPMIRATASLSDVSMLYFKFSDHYINALDVTSHAQEIRSRIGDQHIVWGSDWPPTQHEKETDFGAVRALRDGSNIGSDGAAASALYNISLNRR